MSQDGKPPKGVRVEIEGGPSAWQTKIKIDGQEVKYIKSATIQVRADKPNKLVIDRAFAMLQIDEKFDPDKVRFQLPFFIEIGPEHTKRQVAVIRGKLAPDGKTIVFEDVKYLSEYDGPLYPF